VRTLAADHRFALLPLASRHHVIAFFSGLVLLLFATALLTWTTTMGAREQARPDARARDRAHERHIGQP
jgi:hypothetical protein